MRTVEPSKISQSNENNGEPMHEGDLLPPRDSFQYTPGAPRRTSVELVELNKKSSYVNIDKTDILNAGYSSGGLAAVMSEHLSLNTGLTGGPSSRELRAEVGHSASSSRGENSLEIQHNLSIDDKDKCSICGTNSYCPLTHGKQASPFSKPFNKSSRSGQITPVVKELAFVGEGGEGVRESSQKNLLDELNLHPTDPRKGHETRTLLPIKQKLSFHEGPPPNLSSLSSDTDSPSPTPSADTSRTLGFQLGFASNSTAKLSTTTTTLMTRSPARSVFESDEAAVQSQLRMVSTRELFENLTYD